jgi:hypothetical protein
MALLGEQWNSYIRESVFAGGVDVVHQILCVVALGRCCVGSSPS